MEKITDTKLYIKNTSDFFIEVIKPRIRQQKIQDPFDNYKFKHLNNYNKKIWELFDIPVSSEAERVARSRSFHNAKTKIYFNPDLRFFITLTYKENMQDYQQLQYDMKLFLKNQRNNISKEFKYIYVVEKQKRGALHIHMITNDAITIQKNRYNKRTLKYWPHGYDNIQDIDIKDSNETDLNFKPFLYMYKYMNKSEKIGGRYVHFSRNLNNYDKLTDYQFSKKNKELIYDEQVYISHVDNTVTRNYYKAITKE